MQHNKRRLVIEQEVKLKKKKRKKSPLTLLKDKTWAECSRYHRLKHADINGNVQCYTCGVNKPWKEMQAGHGLSGRSNSILFLDEIIRTQCYICNCCNSGKLDIFIHKLIQEVGKEKVDEYFAVRWQPKQFTMEELEELKCQYQEKIKKLLYGVTVD